MDIESSIRNVILSFEQSSQRLTEILNNIKNEIFGPHRKKIPEQKLAHLQEVVHSLLLATVEATSVGEDLLNDLPPSIEWVTKTNKPMEMTWETGITPWSFWLRYEDQESEVKDLINLIKEQWSGGELESEGYPSEGSNVTICSKRRCYRGYITSIRSNNKIRVLNVDDGRERDEELSACFKLTKEHSALPANVIHCALGKGDFESLWKMQYSEDFVGLLQECRLSVRILEQLSTSPPTFVIELFAFNEDNETEISLRDWIMEKCDIMLPSYGKPPAPDPELISPKFQVLSKGPSVANCDLGELCSDFENDLSFEEKIPVKLANDVERGSTMGGENRLLKITQTLVSNEKEPKIKQYTPPIRNSDTPFKFESVIDVPEYVPVKNACQHSISVLAMNGTIEGLINPVQFIPQDDTLVCSFYSNKGYCWKKGCTKLHPEKIAPGKMTNLSEEIFSETFLNLRLPERGVDEKVLVTHVVSSNSFYIQLPQSYTGSESSESLEDLEKALNSPVPIKEMTLNPNPTIGEFIIAFSSLKMKWLRASVCDIYEDDTIQVFFVDHGITEEVSIRLCRHMLPQFNHLPSQAVFCILSKVCTSSSPSGNGWKKSTGKTFLESNILDKTILIHVVDSNEGDNRLDVEATLNGVSINQLVVDKGFCIRFA